MFTANPHIEDELVEIKDELGEVFSSSIPDDYYQRLNLKGIIISIISIPKKCVRPQLKINCVQF